MTWGIIPAAGIGSRIQPLAFSKELLPVGSRIDDGVERPRAVSEYLIERMILGGATKIAFVISPTKSDIIEYFGGGIGETRFAYVVQQHPGGLCDAIFQALPLLGDEPVLVGLPDTIWYPSNGLASLPDDRLSFLCFPVEEPQHFDAVVSDPSTGRVREVQVKQPAPASHWVWGAFKLPATTLRDLHTLWREPGRGDTYIGTLVNAYLARGGIAFAAHDGTAYVDVGTLHGWRDAVHLLERRPAEHWPQPYRSLTAAR